MNWIVHRRLALLLVVQLLAPRLLSADSVDDYIREQMSVRHIPGLALVVIKEGKVVKQQSYGLANVELGVRTTKDSVFPLASITKVFTATAVYLLVQQHKIRLEDKVTHLLPGLPEAWSEITVLNCLSHTSGLPDVSPTAPIASLAGWITASTQEGALKKLAAVPLVSKPGEKSVYNQTEFLLLKMIVETASSTRLEDFLDKQIFKPLSLSSARFGDSVDIVPNRVALYMNFPPETDRFHVERNANGDGLPSSDGKLWNDLSFLYPEYQHGGVGLNMSATDLGAFDTALTGGRVLDGKTLELMWTPFRLNNGLDAEFAGGWDTDVINGHRMVFHIGAGMVEYAHLIDSKLTIILLTNHKGFNPHRLTIGVLRFFATE